jgi:putative transposase
LGRCINDFFISSYATVISSMKEFNKITLDFAYLSQNNLHLSLHTFLFLSAVAQLVKDGRYAIPNIPQVNNRVITGSNQLWETDIKYGWIAGECRFFFIMCILDVFDRAIISYHLGLTCEAKHLVQITQEALMKRRLFDKPKEEKPVIRSDNGPQFISHLFESACDLFEMIHERIPPRTPNKNTHIESFHSILEAECYGRHEFESYPQTYEIVTQFIQHYNQQRIHGSIYDLSPYEYMDALKKNLLKPSLLRCKTEGTQAISSNSMGSFD